MVNLTSDSGLCSMPDDDLVSLTCFETLNSAGNDSQEGTAETLNAFADMPAQSGPLGHLHEELCTLQTKVDQLESNISKKVADDIQSSVPSIVADTVKANMSGLLPEALKNTLPQMIQYSINNLFQNPLKRNCHCLMHKFNRPYKISFLAFFSSQ
ncbi:hypothetical protein Tco_1069454 [Tanacetum coccineum]|uniref:Uncharacterized protein n=1 Tax=Tanacetum coccineum TaxID=301880 RepID=A0ABQ5HIJ2_9ASTR